MSFTEKDKEALIALAMSEPWEHGRPKSEVFWWAGGSANVLNDKWIGLRTIKRLEPHGYVTLRHDKQRRAIGARLTHKGRVQALELAGDPSPQAQAYIDDIKALRAES